MVVGDQSLDEVTDAARTGRRGGLPDGAQRQDDVQVREQGVGTGPFGQPEAGVRLGGRVARVADASVNSARQVVSAAETCASSATSYEVVNSSSTRMVAGSSRTRSRACPDLDEPRVVLAAAGCGGQLDGPADLSLVVGRGGGGTFRRCVRQLGVQLAPAFKYDAHSPFTETSVSCACKVSRSLLHCVNTCPRLSAMAASRQGSFSAPGRVPGYVGRRLKTEGRAGERTTPRTSSSSASSSTTATSRTTGFFLPVR